MSSALFAWPKQAEFNRVLPKNKIYEHARPSRSIRERFVEEVDQIVWKYKLSPETVNLPARPGVPEIQIFTISLRTAELSASILRTIESTRWPSTGNTTRTERSLVNMPRCLRKSIKLKCRRC